MHGMYSIVLIDAGTGEEIAHYAAPTHPNKEDYIQIQGIGRLRVVTVTHILKTGRDGGGTYNSLNHVQLEVFK